MCRYVLREQYEKDGKAARELAVATGQAFLHSGAFSHGQMLTAADLKAQDNIHIKINELDRDDAVWCLIWQIHCACDVLFGMPVGQNISKLFEAAETTFPVY